MLCLWQGDYFKGDMSKIQKKKAHVAEVEPKVEIITKVEYIYEDTKATTGVEHVGDIYNHTHSFGQIGLVKPLS